MLPFEQMEESGTCSVCMFVHRGAKMLTLGAVTGFIDCHHSNVNRPLILGGKIKKKKRVFIKLHLYENAIDLL